MCTATNLRPHDQCTCAQGRNTEAHLVCCLILLAAGVTSCFCTHKDCHRRGQSLGAPKHVRRGEAEGVRAAHRDDWSVSSLSRDQVRKGQVTRSLLSMLLNHVGLLERRTLVAQAKEHALIIFVSIVRRIMRCFLSFSLERCLPSGVCGARRRADYVRQTLSSFVGVYCAVEDGPLGASGCAGVLLSHRLPGRERREAVCVAAAQGLMYYPRIRYMLRPNVLCGAESSTNIEVLFINQKIKLCGAESSTGK